MAHSSATVIVTAEMVIDNREGQGKVGKTMESYGREEDLITGFATTGMTNMVMCFVLRYFSCHARLSTRFTAILKINQLVFGT